MNDTIRGLTERRSVRRYLPRQVDEAALQDIIQAGLYAPSGMGKQPCELIVVQDKATRDQLSRMNAAVMGSDGDPFYGAPALIIVLEDLDIACCPGFDGALVMGNLLNAAYSVGVDSCWINRAQEMFETEEGKSLLKKWGLTGNYRGVGICILGYHDGAYPEARPRREGTVIRIR